MRSGGAVGKAADVEAGWRELKAAFCPPWPRKADGSGRVVDLLVKTFGGVLALSEKQSPYAGQGGLALLAGHC